MDRKEYNEKRKQQRAERRANGLCAYCGKESKNYRCDSCKSQQSESYKRCRDYRLKIGICPYCKKNTIYGDEKICLECSASYFAKYTKFDRVKENEKARRYRAKKMLEIQDNPLVCTSCYKPKKDDGYRTCNQCRVRNRLRLEHKRAQIVRTREYRRENNLCACCDQPRYKENKLCKMHYEKRVEDNRKMDKSNMKQMNQLFFVKI